MTIDATMEMTTIMTIMVQIMRILLFNIMFEGIITGER